MALGSFDETAYGDVGNGDERDGPVVDTRPCPGPPHHNPRCCLAPAPRSAVRRMADVVRAVRGRRGHRA